MKRRTLVSGGVAAVAALSGAGWATWREQEKTRQDSDASARVWALSFDQPQGGALPLAQWRGRPLLVNFWATWCPPCLKEMPLLSEFQRQQGANGWQVVGLAVDNLAAVQAYLKRSPVDFPIGLAGFGGLDLAFELGNASRQLPFSVLLDRSGRLVEHKLGAFTQAELAAWAAAPTQ